MSRVEYCLHIVWRPLLMYVYTLCNTKHRTLVSPYQSTTVSTTNLFILKFTYVWTPRISFLALPVLTQQSYCHGAGVGRLRLLRNCCMDPEIVVWEATYPPYLQTIFFSFFNILIFQIFTIFFGFR